MPSRSILLAAQKLETRSTLRGALERIGCDVLECSQLKTALQTLHARSPKLLVSDIEYATPLARARADEASHQAELYAPILLSGLNTPPHVVYSAIQEGALAVFEYPREELSIVETIRGLLPEVGYCRATSRLTQQLEQRRMLHQALILHDWNLSKVARTLGWARRTVYNRIDKFQIRRPSIRGLPMRVERYADPSTTLSQATTDTRSKRVLVVDDSEYQRVELQAVLTQVGLDVHSAEDGAVAWEAFQQDRYDCVVTDLKMPIVDGIELIERIREIDGVVPIVLVSGYAEVASTVAAMQAGAQHVYRYAELDFQSFGAHIQQLAATHRPQAA